MKHFGLLTYSGTNNLGDEIQSLAARRFLPRVDRYISREDLQCDPACDGAVSTILNGWFLHHPERWPPHPAIRPLLTSFHVSQSKPSRWRPWKPGPAQIVMSPENIEYLRRHGPVGARDRATLSLLSRHDVDSFYSGCLTLTLPAPKRIERKDIVACDLDADLLRVFASRLRAPPLVTTHTDNVTRSEVDRFAKAESLLQLYAGARLVVTSRLHCALPCIAFRTPVLFIPRTSELDRQQPALELAHHMSREDFLTGRGRYDLEDPPPNPGLYTPLAEKLAAQCEAFVAEA